MSTGVERRISEEMQLKLKHNVIFSIVIYLGLEEREFLYARSILEQNVSDKILNEVDLKVSARSNFEHRECDQMYNEVERKSPFPLSCNSGKRREDSCPPVQS